MNRFNRSNKPDWVPPRSAKLLDQVRERVRYLHYSLQTEKVCVYWAKAFVLWTARSGGWHRQPARCAGAADLKEALSPGMPPVPWPGPGIPRRRCRRTGAAGFAGVRALSQVVFS